MNKGGVSTVERSQQSRDTAEFQQSKWKQQDDRYRQMPRILGLEQGIALELELDVEEELGPVKD